MTPADPFRTVAWADGAVRLLDQTLLPNDVVYLDLTTVEAVAEAIESLRVRGAPTIGAAAAYGLALAAHCSPATTRDGLLADLHAARVRLAATRPTAVNLTWALDRLMASAAAPGEPAELRQRMVTAAERLFADEAQACQEIGRLGAALLGPGTRVLTHCNAGGLATVAYGTALGVVRAAAEQGRVAMVFADETRPLLQGARLTAWELVQSHIPVTVVADNMAAHLMQQGRVDCVITGADRIAANGDTANKIGTYGLAVLAAHHGLPCYVAAPVSTFDFNLADGRTIPIEERGEGELRGWHGTPTVPAGAAVYNPAFDVTPAELITAIITERGIFRPPYSTSLRALR